MMTPTSTAGRTGTLVLFTLEVDKRPLVILPVTFDGTLTSGDELELVAVKRAWQELIVDTIDPKDIPGLGFPPKVTWALWHAFTKPYADRLGIRLARPDEVRDWEAGREAFMAHKREHPEKYPADADGVDRWDGYSNVMWRRDLWRAAGEPARFTIMIDGHAIETLGIPAPPDGRLLTNATVDRWSAVELTDVLRTVFGKIAPALCRDDPAVAARLAGWESDPRRFSFRRASEDE